MSTADHPPPHERRYAGLALTVLVHAALVVAWQMSRHVPAQETGPAPKRIQWVWLPVPAAPPALPAQRPAKVSAAAKPAALAVAPAATPSAAPARPAAPISLAPAAPAASAEPAVTPAPTPAAPATMPSSAEILQRARRDVGAIDRALRKENRPYIVAPLDSPQIRLQNGLQAAHDMAPPKLWEAPKVEALVNVNGDGARRERVITGNGTYCVTDRGIDTSIDMIEKHGKQRLTNCPQHETPATRQAWRTARD